MHAPTSRNSKSPSSDCYRNVFLLLILCGLTVHASAAVTVTKTNYHGWSGSYVIANETVEAIVVPAIGRVMQFRFVGDAQGPFWENRAMDGKLPIPNSKEWGNFGGDKSWPAPQEDWPKVTPRGWPPPVAFDSMPVEANIEGSEVEGFRLRLVSAVDPHFGIRAQRIITLDDTKPLMTIETIYQKIEGEPRKVGVWIITQLNEPDFVYAPTMMDDKFIRQSEALPQNLKVGKRAITLKRSPTKSTKIGTDSSSLYWVGPKNALRIDSPRIEGQEYPDKGSSAEVYTNPNPLTYVELEMLGPLKTLKAGDTLAQRNTYTLLKRDELGAEVVADVK